MGAPSPAHPQDTRSPTLDAVQQQVIERNIDGRRVAQEVLAVDHGEVHTSWLAGFVEVTRTDPATGLLVAGADPRRPAYAIVS